MEKSHHIRSRQKQRALSLLTGLIRARQARQSRGWLTDGPSCVIVAADWRGGVLYEAGVLTVVGMTTVFGFLGLLVCLMHVSARIIERFPGEPAAVEASPPSSVDPGDDAQIAAVLAVVASQRGGS